MGRTGNETVLLYNLDNDKGRKIRVILIQLGMKIRNVKKEEFGEPVGELIGLGISETSGKVQAATDAALRSQEAPGTLDFDDEMMVLHGFTNDRLDELLARMRKARIERVALKAIITPTNRTWSGRELYAELKKEHEALSGK